MSTTWNVVVRERGKALPILVRDIATVHIARSCGKAVSRDGRGRPSPGMVMMLLGENSRTVLQRAKEKLKEVQKTLPPDVKLEIIYDRSDLISRTLETVMHNLLEGGVLVIIVLLVTLGSWRAGLIVAVAIPLSMLFATNIMLATGISASFELPIDFGLVVDSSVIMIENCMRRIAHHSPASRTLRSFAKRLGSPRPTMFGELIIAVVYLPILTLQGTEVLFTLMALTVRVALGGSLILSLTLMPVLAYVALPATWRRRIPGCCEW
jgi:cobalt-zinc-cadmium resistance protein CzcA